MSTRPRENGHPAAGPAHRRLGGRHAAQSQRRPRRGRHRGATQFGVLAAGLIVLVTSSVYGLVSTGTAPRSDAKSKVKCSSVTGMAYADPIVYHNATGNAGHLHTFFGNNALLSLANPNAANYISLAGKPTSCENSADTAGYWMPTLIDKRTGKAVPVHSFTAYYRSFDREAFGEAQAFPADTRLISKPTSDTRINNWSCSQNSAAEPTAYIPECRDSKHSRLTAHITFPSCWNGVRPSHKPTDVGRTEDTAHYAYASQRGECPSGFPVRMVEMRETIKFDFQGSASDLMLASDMQFGTSGGRSLHADFWNTWSQAGFEQMVRNCITSGRARPQTPNECG